MTLFKFFLLCKLWKKQMVFTSTTFIASSENNFDFFKWQAEMIG